MNKLNLIEASVGVCDRGIYVEVTLCGPGKFLRIADPEFAKLVEQVAVNVSKAVAESKFGGETNLSKSEAYGSGTKDSALAEFITGLGGQIVDEDPLR